MGLATARRMGQKGYTLVLAARTPKKSRPGAAYAISKYFVIWYARHEAARFGARGVRVLSVTPGNFDTPMGKLEKDEAGAYLKFNAIPRMGKPGRDRRPLRRRQRPRNGLPDRHGYFVRRRMRGG